MVSFNKKKRGFTLLEVLVTLFVFSLITAFAFRGINSLISSNDLLTSEKQALYDLQRFLFLFESDVKQYSPMTKALGSELDEGQIVSDVYFFNRRSSEQKNQLQFLSYKFEDNKIWRSDDPSLIAEQKRRIVLLDHVERFSISFLEPDDKSKTDMRLNLVHEVLGSVERIFYVNLSTVDMNNASQSEGNNSKPLTQEEIDAICAQAPFGC